MVLGQIVDSIDAGLLYAPNWDYHRKSEMMIQRLIDSFKEYSTEVSEIIHASCMSPRKRGNKLMTNEKLPERVGVAAAINAAWNRYFPKEISIYASD